MLNEKDQQIVWPGPLPLFAVTHFSVSAPDKVENLIGLAQGFANIVLPSQPITVEAVNYFEPKDLGERGPKATFQPPENWNSLRGAAAMAIWGIPSIAPWVELLSKWLANEKASAIAIHLEAPWLETPPWSLSNSEISTAECGALWLAMIDVFSRANIRESWRPNELLEAIFDLARKTDHRVERLDALLHETGEILEDKRTVNLDQANTDPVALVLQLILLRPKPEHFITWKAEFPALPPAVWWSGVILSGLINGYRNLESRFRGTIIAEKTASITTWQGASTSSKWPADMLPDPKYSRSADNIKLQSGSALIFEKKLGRRGSWYDADYSLPEVMAAASAIAEEQGVKTFNLTLTIEDCKIALSGDGRLTVQEIPKTLEASGRVFMEFPESAKLNRRFSSELFKKWIAVGKITRKLPAPPIAMAPTTIDSMPVGLLIVEDFLTSDEEEKLIEFVDNASWLNTLSRRVQHYGWKYDYSLRKVLKSSYLGALPDWAQVLAERLVAENLMPELADQVIVNEYLKDQGISKHVDCPTCFKGPIVTISLCESWRMVFRRGKDKFETTLYRRSAASLNGPARHEWTHEIPSRKFEGTSSRVRRISLTFRKVDTSNLA
ncbi:alpha-ketoglutarate-dependent dioxygenase AlkB [Pseudomonas syringae]|uniref:alpha-ketoglutarate-dependent dioxygenase AlkB n=1 Tax=Pseudomonas syringae TaxID=317 RepID=UPI003F753F6B